MVIRPPSFFYWDSSAVLSLLLPDRHHERARAWARSPGIHFISTLTFAEVVAVISRQERERAISATTAKAARGEMRSVAWRRLQESPDWIMLGDLASKWPLAGPDLWHLALAKTLQQEQPDLRLLSFDERLAKAAAGEGLVGA